MLDSQLVQIDETWTLTKLCPPSENPAQAVAPIEPNRAISRWVAAVTYRDADLSPSGHACALNKRRHHLR
jgi:hypothetical protein